MAEIGDVLTRKRKLKDGRDQIRITGAVNSVFVAEAAQGFGAPFTITGEELAREYGATVQLPESEADCARRIDAAVSAALAKRYFRGRAVPPESPPEGSPEAVFAAIAAKEAHAADD